MRPRRLAPVDLAWLAVDNPRNPVVVTAVLRLAGPLALADLRALVAERLVNCYPSFGYRLKPGGRWRRPRWVVDTNFAVDHHVLPVPAGRSVDDAELTALTGELMSRPLDMHRTPWVIHLVHDERGCAALIVRAHHCLADGMALAHVLLGMADDMQDDGSDAGLWVGSGSVARHRRWRRVRQTARAIFGVVPTMIWLLATLGEPRTSLRLDPAPRKVVAWTQAHELTSVKRASRAHGVTVNDVLLAAVAGGVRRYFESRDEVPANIRVVVPVDLRDGAPPSPSLGNRLGLAFVRLPVRIVDPARRLREVARVTSRIKRSVQAGSTWAVLSLVGLVPALAATAGVRVVNGCSSGVVTNVPGPRHQLSLGGAPVASVVFWVPQVGRMSLGVSIFSYAGSVTVGVACDATVPVDPARLASWIDEEITALSTALACEANPTGPATVDPDHRRVI
ncbi:MAG: WS/DGAT domain-containing protein [Actinomycetota bacterium]